MIPTQEQLNNRTAWMEALRSGKYGQCQGVLSEYGNYCCLGVALDLAGELSQPDADDAARHHAGNYYMPCDAWFAKHYGIPARRADAFTRSCSRYNDHDKLSFLEVATRVEALFAGLDADEAFPLPAEQEE